MTSKAIRVSDDVHEKLIRIKVDYKFKNISQVVEIITDLYDNKVLDELFKLKDKLRLSKISDVIKFLVDHYYNRWRVGLWERSIRYQKKRKIMQKR